MGPVWEYYCISSGEKGRMYRGEIVCVGGCWGICYFPTSYRGGFGEGCKEGRGGGRGLDEREK